MYTNNVNIQHPSHNVTFKQMKNRIIPLLTMLMIISCTTGHKDHTDLKAEPVRVKTVNVQKEHIVSSLRYSGTIEAGQTIPLQFRITGTITKVLVEEGDRVRKGQLLAALDETDALSMHEISLSQYQQAKDAYDRMKSVHEKGSLPDIKWVEIESKLIQAQSSLDLAGSNLEKCKLFAPADGWIGRRNIEPGMSSLSLTNTPLELVDIRTVYVKIAVPENEIPRIKKGMRSVVVVPALNDREFSGIVTTISPVADRLARTYEARILLQNDDAAMKPGMVCDVRMETTMEKEVLVVPHACVSKDNGNNLFVFEVKPGSAQAVKRVITAGVYHDSGIEVIAGIEAGAMIVQEGKEKLTDSCLIAY
jgi:RND family efflux transporter MFP subunit